MKRYTKIAVLGGGGKTGKYLLKQLINQGYQPKLLLRNPEAISIKDPFIEIIEGDALDPNTIHVLLRDCQAIISTLGQRQGEPLTAELATKNILEAMEKYGLKRYILIGGINIDTPFDKKGQETTDATNWMKANFPLIQEDRQRAYTRLLASNVQWTLVRVPFIEFIDTVGNIVIDLEDCPGNKISAGNVAGFLIEQLRDDRFINKSPFIADAPV